MPTQARPIPAKPLEPQPFQVKAGKELSGKERAVFDHSINQPIRPSSENRMSDHDEHHDDDHETVSEEKIVYVASPSMFRNHPFAFSLTILLCCVGVGLPILLVWWIRSKSTELTVTDKRTRLRRGWLSRSVTEVWHRDVRNVQLHQSFSQRLLDTGRIGVSSAGQGGIEIDVSGLRDPDQIKGIIDEHRSRAKNMR
jgi:hypothetical protein